MTGLVRKAAVLAACGVIFGVAVAAAGIPDPLHSTIPGHINLVGFNTTSTLPDSVSNLAKVQVVVRDLANTPIPNSTVILDFSGTTSDTRIADVQLYRGLTTDCVHHTVYALTDATGTATFVVMGSGLPAPGAAHLKGAGKVIADGIQLGTIGVGEYDLNGSSIGVALGDLSTFSGDLFSAANTTGSPTFPNSPDRSNFNGNANVDLGDLSNFSTTLFSLQSNNNSATYCP